MMKPFMIILSSLSVALLNACVYFSAPEMPDCVAKNGNEYCVQKDDTITRLSLRFDVPEEEIIRLNHLENKGLYPGQLLRLRDSLIQETSVFPLQSQWQLPVKGKVFVSFDSEHKGVDFAAEAKESVVAVDDGQVIFARNQLARYGKTVLLRHSNTLMSVYAHTGKILVKEGEKVKKGQIIAQVGNTEHQKPSLHFEVRVNGEAVNPADYLLLNEMTPQ